MKIYRLFFLLLLALCGWEMVMADEGPIFTVVANPAEKAATAMRLNWHSLYEAGEEARQEANWVTYTVATDSDWKRARTLSAQMERCAAFDSLRSKRPDSTDCVERIILCRHTIELKGLKPNTRYMYRLGRPGSPSDEGTVRYFQTAPKPGRGEAWSAAIISDFHAYTPIPHRVEVAMAMMDTLESRNGGPVQLALHVGDVCAWGGSYSFWRDLYTHAPYHRYAWAGVNGNHDNMDRKSTRLSNDYTRYTSNYPLNGYEGEMGVCYYFRYGEALFIMLNNESMRSDEGLAAAQQWVRRVTAMEKARFVVVMEHYQWFFANTGRVSQYERWHELFDACGVDLAIAGNHHIYARTAPLYQGREVEKSAKQPGTVYLQTPSCDDERGMVLKEWTENRDIIKYRWSEGQRTVGALLMKAEKNRLSITLYNRMGEAMDSLVIEK